MANKRKALSKKIRFEVFKRDGFICQYCGRQPPEVILNVDHISPVAKGGGNDIVNLVTACRDCNAGKGARQLSDRSLVKAQGEELARQQERIEQLKMMHDWSLARLSEKEQAVIQLAEYWNKSTGGWDLTASGRKLVTKTLNRFGYVAAVEALEAAIDSYGEWDDKGALTKSSVNKCFDKLHGICKLREDDDKLPGSSRLPYLVAIAQNRFSYCDRANAFATLKAALSSGVEIEDLEACTKMAKNWSAWRTVVNELMSEAPHGGEING